MAKVSISKKSLRRLVESTLGDLIGSDMEDKVRQTTPKKKSYIKNSKKVSADTEGTLGNLAKRMLNHDAEELKQFSNL